MTRKRAGCRYAMAYSLDMKGASNERHTRYYP